MARTASNNLALTLRAIRGDCKAFGIDDATRRDIMQREAGVTSSTQLDMAGANKVRAYINKHYRQKQGDEWAFIDSAAEDRQPLLRRIIVFCRDLGIQRGGQVSYVEGIARQMAGLKPGLYNVDKPLRLCGRDELRNIAFALDKQQKRQAKD